MKKTFLVLFLILACSVLVVAQDESKAEVFGGYQWTNVGPGAGIERVNFNGWDAALTGYFNRNVGITADFSGAYKTESGASLKMHSYTFGPTFRVPSKKATPFVHALFGGAHISGSALSLSASTNGFAYILGGGVDVHANRNLSIRLGQFDYVGTRIEGENQKNFRYSGGVVFRF